MSGLREGRTILVSGASAGIGAAISRRLHDSGHRVIGLARDFTKLASIGEGFYPETVDLSDLDALPHRLEELLAKYPDVDGVVCNAGRGQFGSLEEFSFSQIRALIDLNFTSHTYLARAFLPGMKREKRGDLVFIGSEAALSGGRRGAVYAATKAALGALARALREECARSGVRVAVIHPGMVRTDFFSGLAFGPGAEAENALLPDEVAQVVERILAARPGAVFDEIRLSPLKKVVKFRSPDDSP